MLEHVEGGDVQKSILKWLEGLFNLEQNCGWKEGDRSEAQVKVCICDTEKEEDKDKVKDLLIELSWQDTIKCKEWKDEFKNQWSLNVFYCIYILLIVKVRYMDKDYRLEFLNPLIAFLTFNQSSLNPKE